MRLWTIHPRFLDAKGLVALWREGLLAKAVIEAKTRGYTRHPQLTRFRAHPEPLRFIGEYLRWVLIESRSRGYRFDPAKLPPAGEPVEPIEESVGQLRYEWRHLLDKLAVRDPERFERLSRGSGPRPHPLFDIVPGEVKSWEKA